LRESPLVVEGYLKRLKQSGRQKPAQVRESLEIYIQLWERAIRNGVVTRDEAVAEALKKIDAKGGLYAAAGD
jgi:hypothetical protein